MRRIFLFPTVAEAKRFILSEPRDAVFVGGSGMAEIAAAVVRAVKAKKPHLIVLCGVAESCDAALQCGEVVEVVTERVAGLPEGEQRIYETTGPDLGLPAAAGITCMPGAEIEAAGQTGAGSATPGGGMFRSGTEPGDAGAGPEISCGEDGTEAGAGSECGNLRAGGGEGPGAENRSASVEPGTGSGIGTEAGSGAGESGHGHGDDVPGNDPSGIGLSALSENASDADPFDGLPVVCTREGAAFLAVCEALGVEGCQIRAVVSRAGARPTEAQFERAVENLTQTLTHIFADHEE